MNLTADEIERIAAQTLDHYEQHAQAFWQGTRDHDVSQNIAALLQYIEAPAPFEILDFGCGPGRDLRTFKLLGHRATGLEGASQLVAMARTYSGCDVLQQNFLQLNLPGGQFDGVFANAVLFHVPSQALPRVLADLFATLKPVACSSAQTRAATVKRAGTATAMAPFTICPLGVVICQRPDSSN